jgi:hypothetical protein
VLGGDRPSAVVQGSELQADELPPIGVQIELFVDPGAVVVEPGIEEMDRAPWRRDDQAILQVSGHCPRGAIELIERGRREKRSHACGWRPAGGGCAGCLCRLHLRPAPNAERDFPRGWHCDILAEVAEAVTVVGGIHDAGAH